MTTESEAHDDWLLWPVTWGLNDSGSSKRSLKGFLQPSESFWPAYWRWLDKFSFFCTFLFLYRAALFINIIWFCSGYTTRLHRLLAYVQPLWITHCCSTEKSTFKHACEWLLTVQGCSRSVFASRVAAEFCARQLWGNCADKCSGITFVSSVLSWCNNTIGTVELAMSIFNYWVADKVHKYSDGCFSPLNMWLFVLLSSV